jgi:hypothetical protein
MARMGMPSSKISFEQWGAASEYTDCGPPERMIALGAISFTFATEMSKGWTTE